MFRRKNANLNLNALLEQLKSGNADEAERKLAKVLGNAINSKSDGGIYLLPEDISELIEEFSALERQIKEHEDDATDSYIILLNKVVENAVITRIEDISRQRKTERAKELMRAKMRDYFQTPRYSRPWWRLFRKTPNDAMKLIEEREAQEARLLHLQMQEENDDLCRQADESEIAYERYKIRLKAAGQESEEEPEEEPEEEAEALPVRKPRSVTAASAPEPSPTDEELTEAPAPELNREEAQAPALEPNREEAQAPALEPNREEAQALVPEPNREEAQAPAPELNREEAQASAPEPNREEAQAPAPEPNREEAQTPALEPNREEVEALPVRKPKKGDTP